MFTWGISAAWECSGAAPSRWSRCRGCWPRRGRWWCSSRRSASAPSGRSLPGASSEPSASPGASCPRTRSGTRCWWASPRTGSRRRPPSLCPYHWCRSWPGTPLTHPQLCRRCSYTRSPGLMISAIKNIRVIKGMHLAELELYWKCLHEMRLNWDLLRLIIKFEFPCS